MRLRAGPLTMLLDPETAFLRRICLGKFEVLRGVYGAVRDRDWGTVEPVLSGLAVEPAGDGFRVGFTAVCRRREIHFVWEGEISGNDSGVVVYRMRGEARSTFLRNRIGLCALHPIAECAGRPCIVRFQDGSVLMGDFPREISPQQPFKNLQTVAHELLPGLRVQVKFEGEVFEMEDQRNWSDASFKTYGTPLALPYPAEILIGTRIEQAVTLRLAGPKATPTVYRDLLEAESGVASGAGGGALSIGDGKDGIIDIDEPTQSPLPSIGLCRASQETAASNRALDRLRALRLGHLRVDLELDAPEWRESLLAAITESRQLETPLYLGLHLSEATAWEPFLQTIREQAPAIALWLVYRRGEKAASRSWVERAQARLGELDPRIPVAAGTEANFAELNRNRPWPESTAYPCFSLNPQVHAFDNLTLVENLEAQAAGLNTLRSFTKNPVVISPITLRPQFNPVATGTETEPAEGGLPWAVDCRQMSLFGVAWTLGSLSALVVSEGLFALTYYETVGWRGVMETEAGSRLPERFPSPAGAVFPLYHVFADFAEFTHASPLPSVNRSSLTGVALSNGQGNRRLLLANLRPTTQSVRLRIPGRTIQARVLDQDNVENAMQNPEAWRAERERIVITDGLWQIGLGPYAYLCLDWAI